MSTFHDILSCEEMQLLIEEYLDGELALGQAPLVELHLGRCRTCADELTQARRVREALRALPQKRCPDAVSAAVVQRARADVRLERWRRWRLLLTGALLRPASVMAALLVLAALGGAFFVYRHGPAAPEYSAADVARAEQDLRWTLAYVAAVHEKAGLTVRDEVIEKRVVAPMKRAAEEVL
jgi:anti-sigma factor RsiW